MRTATLAHTPSKKIQSPPQVVIDPVSRPESLDTPSTATGAVEEDSGDNSLLEHSDSLTTDADFFGIYQV